MKASRGIEDHTVCATGGCTPAYVPVRFREHVIEGVGQEGMARMGVGDEEELGTSRRGRARSAGLPLSVSASVCWARDSKSKQASSDGPVATVAARGPDS